MLKFDVAADDKIISVPEGYLTETLGSRIALTLGAIRGSVPETPNLPKEGEIESAAIDVLAKRLVAPVGSGFGPPLTGMHFSANGTETPNSFFARDGLPLSVSSPSHVPPRPSSMATSTSIAASALISTAVVAPPAGWPQTPSVSMERR